MKTNILRAIRNIIKNRVNAFITVIGLAIAFACLILIYLYVSQEAGYNNFHQNADRLYRINYSVKLADGSKKLSTLLNPALSKVIKDKVPQIKRSTAFRMTDSPTFKFENRNFEGDICITEPEFFNMFSFKLVIGNKDQLFKNPDEIVITESLAAKFQAISGCTKDALMGKPVFFMNIGDKPFVISGIMENAPKNSSIQFEAIIPYKYEGAFKQSSNMFGNSTIYYEINKSGDAQLAEKQINQVLREYHKGLITKLQNENIISQTDEAFSPCISSIKEVYLGNVESDYERSNSKSALGILSAIGFLIALIACSNFMLLSLGQSLKKVGEVSVRKVLGAGRGNIFGLFFTENMLLTLVALIIGGGLCYSLLPVFNRLSENMIYLNLVNTPALVLFVVTCVLLLVVSISMVPVLKLIKTSPDVSMLKNKGKGGGNKLTSLFVTLQYGLSIFLIILTIFIVRQTDYMKKSDLGLSSENILNLRVYHLDNSDKLALRDQLKNYSGVQSLTLTNRDYISGASGEFIKNGQGENIPTRILKVDQDYISTLGLKLIQGTNFETTNIREGDQSVIINEKLLGRLGLKNDPVGQTVTMNGNNLRIIGVLKDFHYDSMKDNIEPLVLCPIVPEKCNYIFIKYNPAQLNNLTLALKTTWNKIAPDKELDYKFWHDQLAQRYQSEDRWSQIIAYASIIAILISSLGLFGFTILGINRRVKEIGIRKVNGATVFEVLMMLNKDFLIWVAIAFAVAVPSGWYVMHKWLESFAYKTALSWWIFALSGLIALVIALLTVSWQSWKAATSNPVEALNNE